VAIEKKKRTILMSENPSRVSKAPKPKTSLASKIRGFATGTNKPFHARLGGVGGTIKTLHRKLQSPPAKPPRSIKYKAGIMKSGGSSKLAKLTGNTSSKKRRTFGFKIKFKF